MLRIAILGAGISGLSTGWFLKQQLGSNVDLTIIEKNKRPGGWIQTLQQDEFLFEQGPRSCRTKGAGQHTLALIEALGLQDKVIVPHENAKNRYVYQETGLKRLPRHLWEVPFNSLTRDWLKVLWRDWRMPKRNGEDESIESFFSRRIGKKWTHTLIDSFVSGIYAGDCSRLSLKSCFPLFDQWEQQHGSLLRGALRQSPQKDKPTPFIQKITQSPMFSFQEGMETLPLALARALKESLLLDQAIKEIKFDGKGATLELSEGETLKVDYVISTLPTFALIPLLKDFPWLRDQLERLSYATVTSINLGYKKNVLPYQGFGYLIPSHYQVPVLGCVWDSSIFPQQNQGDQTRLTVMMGGSHHPAVEHLSSSELINQAQQVLHAHLGIRATPANVQIKKAHRAIPQYELGYADWKSAIQTAVQEFIPRLILSGNAWTGVSINDCVAQARQLADKIANKN